MLLKLFLWQDYKLQYLKRLDFNLVARENL
jgi:hypothetical protein